MRVMQTSRGKGKGVKRAAKPFTDAKAAKLAINDNREESCSYTTTTSGTVYGRQRIVSINDVPSSILGIIFSHLKPLERLLAESVCRRWKFAAIKYGWANQRTISYDELEYDATLKIDLYLKSLHNKHIEILLKRARGNLLTLDIGRLSLANREHINYSLCSSLAFVPNLQTIDLSGIQMTNSSLAMVGRFFPNLKSAAFRNSFKNTQMERGLSSMLMSCQSLVHLDLSENENFLGTSLVHASPTIEQLDISGCFRIEAKSVRIIRDCFINLRQLYMDQIDTLSTQELNEMFKGLTSLTTLKFCECYNNEPPDGQESLTSLGKLSSLKELQVHGNYLINDEVLRSLSIGCRHLESLDISQSHREITDAGLRHLAELPNLVVLKMGGQTSLTDETLTLIAQRGLLKELVVSRCTQITNASVMVLIKCCKHLQCLDVSQCVGVTHIFFNELNKFMEKKHGKTNPRSCAQKFHLSISKSGIQGNLLNNYSSWIQLVDYSVAENVFHGFIPFAQPHFLNIPLIML